MRHASSIKILFFFGNGFNLYNKLNMNFIEFRRHLEEKISASDKVSDELKEFVAHDEFSKIETWSGLEEFIGKHLSYFCSTSTSCSADMFLTLVDKIREHVLHWLRGINSTSSIIPAPKEFSSFFDRTYMFDREIYNVPDKKSRRTLHIKASRNPSDLLKPVIRHKASGGKSWTGFTALKVPAWQALDEFLWRNRYKTRKLKFVSLTHNSILENYVSALSHEVETYNHNHRKYHARKEAANNGQPPRIAFDNVVLYPYGFGKLPSLSNKLPPPICIGVANQEQLESVNSFKDKDFIIKRMMKRELATHSSCDYKEVFDQIGASDIICIWGMSLGATDSNIWKSIAEWLQNDMHHFLVIYWYDTKNTHPGSNYEKMATDKVCQLFKSCVKPDRSNSFSADDEDLWEGMYQSWKHRIFVVLIND